jgi:hypothetical protein
MGSSETVLKSKENNVALECHTSKHKNLIRKSEFQGSHGHDYARYFLLTSSHKKGIISTCEMLVPVYQTTPHHVAS